MVALRWDDSHSARYAGSVRYSGTRSPVRDGQVGAVTAGMWTPYWDAQKDPA